MFFLGKRALSLGTVNRLTLHFPLMWAGLIGTLMETWAYEFWDGSGLFTDHQNLPNSTEFLGTHGKGTFRWKGIKVVKGGHLHGHLMSFYDNGIVD